MAVFGIIFQFFFLLDVVAVMLLTFKERKLRWLTISILVVLFLSLLGLIIPVILYLSQIS